MENCLSRGVHYPYCMSVWKAPQRMLQRNSTCSGALRVVCGVYWPLLSKVLTIHVWEYRQRLCWNYLRPCVLLCFNMQLRETLHDVDRRWSGFLSYKRAYDCSETKPLRNSTVPLTTYAQGLQILKFYLITSVFIH